MSYTTFGDDDDKTRREQLKSRIEKLYIQLRTTPEHDVSKRLQIKKAIKRTRERLEDVQIDAKE